MKPDRIKVSAEFPGLWLAAECPVATDENPIEEIKKCRAMLIDAFNEINGGNYSSLPDHPMSVQNIERSREEIIEAHLQTINECKTIRNLEMFANMVQRENEQVLFDAYNKKKKELS